MKRRDFISNGGLLLVTGSLFKRDTIVTERVPAKPARNIIFMVSDGMSTGTLNMADLLLQRKEGRSSHWLQLYRENRVKRALMDTASASSLVTDSAAGSSAWGAGIRVNNGSLNTGPDGRTYFPILQKFREAGKSVGCVTTVTVTHATPAGFCICNNKRGDQQEIAKQYLTAGLDVIMGGGAVYFSSAHRKDGEDLIALFKQKNYQVIQEREELQQLAPGQKLLGLFQNEALPYTLDSKQNSGIRKTVPTLAEMTSAAIKQLRHNKKGFVLQVEAGKVDLAAHANDPGALLYDQLAFDEALSVAIDFAETNKETLVIFTTDHGNANPGIFYGDKTNKLFDALQHYRQTNEWVLNNINREFTAATVIELVKDAQGWLLQKDEAEQLLQQYQQLSEKGVYNPYKLPFKLLGQFQSKHTAIGWGSMDHSGDYVELAMLGPGSELLKPFVKNTDLHNLMLQAAAVDKKYWNAAY